MANPEKPICLSIVICDGVYRDERTQKLVIVGTFNTIGAREFPCRQAHMRVLLSLTNGRGEYELAVSVRNARTEDPIIEMTGPAKMTDPLQIVDIDIAINNMVLPEPGKYWVTVETDGEPIASRPFFAQLIRDQTAEA